ncbi:MAG: thiolase domain-containing protein, partial [Actinobacteria bacterium]|nr:thiolase domain-containing protein [Actinomycetota bacterium]
MTIRGTAHIAGAYEHPLRKIPDKSVAQVHAEVALGALADAGLALSDVDAYFCSGDAPGFGPISMADYLGLSRLRYTDSTETGGSSYIAHVGHAAAAIAMGKCTVALITLAGLPRSQPVSR